MLSASELVESLPSDTFSYCWYNDDLLSIKYVVAHADMLTTTPGWAVKGTKARADAVWLLQRDMRAWQAPLAAQMRDGGAEQDEIDEMHVRLTWAGCVRDVWESVCGWAAFADRFVIDPDAHPEVEAAAQTQWEVERRIEALSIGKVQPRAVKQMKSRIAAITDWQTVMSAVGLAVHLGRQGVVPLRWALSTMERRGVMFIAVEQAATTIISKEFDL